MDEKSAWSDDCTGSVRKYRLLDVVEEYALFMALWHVAATLMTDSCVVDIYRVKFEALAYLGWVQSNIGAVCVFTTHMGLEWAKAVRDIALEIKRRYQNKAAYIGCVMTTGVVVIVHGSSFMETTDHLPMEVTGTCTLESTVHFAVSVNDSSLKENTDTSGTVKNYMALYASIAPIAPLAIAMTNVDGNHKFAPSEILEIVRAGSETAAGATGVAQGIVAIVEAGHKMAGEDSEGKDPEVVADMMIAGFMKYVLPIPGDVAMLDVLNTSSNDAAVLVQTRGARTAAILSGRSEHSTVLSHLEISPFAGCTGDEVRQESGPSSS